MDVSGQLTRIEELMRSGQLAAAEIAAKGLLQSAPRETQAWHFLGVIYLLGGANASAEAAFQEAAALAPQNGDYWSNLSIALYAQDKLAEAEDCARRAIGLNNANGTYWLNLGNVYMRGERWSDAAAAYEQALARDPNDAPAWSNFGAAQHKAGNWQTAEAAYERSLSLAPSAIDASINRARLLADRGQLQQSIEQLKAMVRQHPQNAAAWAALGYALKLAGNLAESEMVYRHVLELSPRQREALFNLALVLYQRWSLAEAETRVRDLIAAIPTHADAWSLLGTIQQSRLEIDEGIASMRRGVELSPGWQRHGKLLMAMQYGNNASAEELLEAHRDWNSRYAQSLWPAAEAAAVRKSGPLRLGFVSSDFGRHPLAFLVLPTLEHLNRARCSVVCYSDRVDADVYTARFRAASDIFRSVKGLTDEELTAQVQADAVDVLFDMGGHASKRLLAFARKPAAVQVSWFGYVGTTGLAAMDFLLADRCHVRDGEEPWYVEAVLRMPNGYACYGAPPDAPDVGPLPAMAKGAVTFGCFNNPMKYSPRIVEAWASILRQVTKSTLLFKFHGLEDAVTQNRLREQFAARGIEPTRIVTEGTAEHLDLLAAYNRVDLALDPQPYSGGVTTCEALWMGVPVITFPGKTFAGRHATSHLSNAGYGQFVAGDVEQYVEMAIEWGNRIDELAPIRAAMREQVARSPLCDAARFAQDFLNLIEHGWQLRCAMH